MDDQFHFTDEQIEAISKAIENAAIAINQFAEELVKAIDVTAEAIVEAWTTMVADLSPEQLEQLEQLMAEAEQESDDDERDTLR